VRLDLSLLACGSNSPVRPTLATSGSVTTVYRAGNRCVTFDYSGALNEAEEAIAIEERLGSQLVLLSGTGSGWAVIVGDNLAVRLEVTEQRRRRIIESIRSRDTSHNTQQAATALHSELDRRGWLPAERPG
jgi:hypothetical protein